MAPISAFSKIRDAATDHGRGENAPSGDQARIAVANCRIYGRAIRNMLVSGRIFAPYGNYMAPEDYFVGETIAVALERCARDTTLRRPFPAVLEDYSCIAIRGASVVSPLRDLLESEFQYDIACQAAADLLDILTNLRPKLQYGPQKQLGLFGNLRDARQILDIAGCELIFTKRASLVIGKGVYNLHRRAILRIECTRRRRRLFHLAPLHLPS